MNHFSSNFKKNRLLAGYMTAKEFARVLEVQKDYNEKF